MYMIQEVFSDATELTFVLNQRFTLLKRGKKKKKTNSISDTAVTSSFTNTGFF